MTSPEFFDAQFDQGAVPDDCADAVTTQDEDLGRNGRHGRPTEPRISYPRGRLETFAWSAALLAGVVLAMTHGVHGAANHRTPGSTGATATPSSGGTAGCVVTRGRPSTDQRPGVDDGSHGPGIVRTDLPRCATEEQRAAESAYLAQLVAKHNSANARPRSR